MVTLAGMFIASDLIRFSSLFCPGGERWTRCCLDTHTPQWEYSLRLILTMSPDRQTKKTEQSEIRTPLYCRTEVCVPSEKVNRWRIEQYCEKYFDPLSWLGKSSNLARFSKKNECILLFEKINALARFWQDLQIVQESERNLFLFEFSIFSCMFGIFWHTYFVYEQAFQHFSTSINGFNLLRICSRVK